MKELQKKVTQKWGRRMLKIAVCDDEGSDREKVCELIRQFGRKDTREFDIQQFESGEQFLGSDYEPDILFLDIVMYEKDGIQTGAEMKRRHPDALIIYTTNFNEQMSTAFNHIHAFGYLVKPISEDDLFRILTDAVQQAVNREKGCCVTFLTENNTIAELPVKDILYFEYLSRKIRIVTWDGTYLCASEKIGRIAEKMKPYGFIMSHQSFVVNLYQVESIDRQMLVMKNGERVYLAQKRASSVRKQLMQLAEESLNKTQRVRRQASRKGDTA